MAQKCVICNKSLKNSKKSLVGKNCQQHLIDISLRNEDGLHKIFSTVTPIELHLMCRNRYIQIIFDFMF